MIYDPHSGGTGIMVGAGSLIVVACWRSFSEPLPTTAAGLFLVVDALLVLLAAPASWFFELFPTAGAGWERATLVLAFGVLHAGSLSALRLETLAWVEIGVAAAR